ncbi:MAG TPA: isocitrate lyase/phosphoenolpyruvate mutase family protein [Solirubrobacteraceae bacterium]|jgi:2-methylisocitrate lyase-like PEP mutase family enzyme|nr:isocitrate lyase/phosphoenolpyruvate mutase family protein [Solirubrobacteraceae bacterium]
MSDQASKAAGFLELHRPGDPLIMPNPWDIGSARLMAWIGFEALATTSSGFAATLGRLDGGVSRDEALAHAQAIAQAVDLPVSADLENCFADDADGVAETARGAAAAGLAGFSIEDYDPDAKSIYEQAVAVERVRAAVETAHAAPGGPLVVTARAEGYLREQEPDRDEIIGRLQAYQEAGADVLFAPGPVDAETVGAIVSSVERPVNVLARKGAPPVSELGTLGVARISVGGALAFSAIGGWVSAARELREQGTYAYFEQTAAGAKAARDAFG